MSRKKLKSRANASLSVRSHPTQSLGSGMSWPGSNELSSSRLPNQAAPQKVSRRSEIDTVSDYSPSGRRTIISSPGHPFGNGQRRKRKKR